MNPRRFARTRRAQQIRKKLRTIRNDIRAALLDEMRTAAIHNDSEGYRRVQEVALRVLNEHLWTHRFERVICWNCHGEPVAEDGSICSVCDGAVMLSSEPQKV